MLIKNERVATGQTDERTAMVETLLLALNTTAQSGTAWYGCWETLSKSAVEDGKHARVNLWLLRDEVAREAGWLPPVDQQTEDMRQLVRDLIADYGTGWVRRNDEEVARQLVMKVTDARTVGDIEDTGLLDKAKTVLHEEVTNALKFLRQV